jgi:uncharacterized protein (DUF1501 family)
MARFDPSRRSFLAQASAAAATASLSYAGIRQAEAAGDDYKALIVYLQAGGNDGSGMIMPVDPGNYALYAAARGPLAIPQGSIVPLNEAGGARYGLHPNLAPLQAVWDRGQMAGVFNVGPMTAPGLSRAQLLANRALIPRDFGSHWHHQVMWQNALVDPDVKVGWGGRLVEHFSSANAGAAFPAGLGLQSSLMLLDGPSSGGFWVPVHGDLSLFDFQGKVAPLFPFLTEDLVRMQHPTRIADAFAQISGRNIAAINVLKTVQRTPSALVDPAIDAWGTGEMHDCFKHIGRIIERRATTGITRQVFVITQHGYDTHGDHADRQQRLFASMAGAVRGFSEAMTTIGAWDKVTLLTISEFGRSLRLNSNGTDHGWGGHHTVFGGAVRGGMYGQFPNLQLGGPSDIGDGGVWIPTLSVEQYLAPAIQWMGVAAGDLPRILPNVGRFSLSGASYIA